jgi:DNA ligase-4
MLCGLRVDQNQIQQGANPQKCYSFFKVGGGFSAGDYAEIRHRTEGKWIQWDPKRPPTEYIELAGGDRQFEQPDVWIKPEDSIVISAKASSVAKTDQFRVGLTLRFPRFKQLRLDKDWKSALSIQEFIELKTSVEKEHAEKKMEVDDERKKRRAPKRKRKRPLVVVGQDAEFKRPYAGPDTKVFGGLNFFIITESLKPEKKSKAELEEMVKAHGGTIVQSQNAKENIICVADREPIKVRSIKKEGKMNIVRPSWLFDCIKQSEIDLGRPPFLLPMEPNHMYFTTEQDRDMIDNNVDEFGDSYCRDIMPSEMQQIFDDMPKLKSRVEKSTFVEQLHDHGVDIEELPGFMFQGVMLYVDNPTAQGLDQVNGNSNANVEADANLPLRLASQMVMFAGGRVAQSIDDPSITHVVVGSDAWRAKTIRHHVAQRPKIPRIVTPEWVSESWKEKTLLDEERFIA